jgi:hypothetical protein
MHVDTALCILLSIYILHTLNTVSKVQYVNLLLANDHIGSVIIECVSASVHESQVLSLHSA